LFSKLADTYGIDGFCVDAIEEGIKLRSMGIEKPILVLGFVYPENFSVAAEYGLTITLSTRQYADAYIAMEGKRPEFHLKVDTGMHRQGFTEEGAITLLDEMHDNDVFKDGMRGMYTHFAMAKDPANKAFTEAQFATFMRVREAAAEKGYERCMFHTAATGGTLLDSKYHLDAVRIGMGLYGLWPSAELEEDHGIAAGKELRQVMRWYSVVSEIKTLYPGDGIGYDLTERVEAEMRAAIAPVGYYHGFSRSLSGVGEVMVGGRWRRILGRVSMGMIGFEVDERVREGDTVALLEDAPRLAAQAGISFYELLSRIQPEIERSIV
jgi:alanine racemase